VFRQHSLHPCKFLQCILATFDYLLYFYGKFYIFAYLFLNGSMVVLSVGKLSTSKVTAKSLKSMTFLLIILILRRMME
jgi:hypothetical protein